MMITRPAFSRTGIIRALKTGATTNIADRRVAISMKSAAWGASCARSSFTGAALCPAGRPACGPEDPAGGRGRSAAPERGSTSGTEH